jgi:8-oxo-dGTP diphosphatase
MRSPISGTRVILEYEGRFLAYRRDDNPAIPFPGRWDFFGGGREKTDRSLLDCGIREVEEELGIPGVELAMLDIVPSIVDPDVQFGRAYGRLTTHQLGGAALTEGQEWGLFTREEIAELDFVPELQEYFLVKFGINRVAALEQTA